MPPPSAPAASDPLGRQPQSDRPKGPAPAIEAQARLHHQWWLGLQLMVATREGPQVMGDWMFRLFRRQHEDKFLASFDKLGLRGLPDADACARYHVLSNGIGGVAVEYMPEGPDKAWVRFRYPRWMYAGPAICGLPVEVSRGFLQGWYAHNGVSLGNPRLGFVCVSEDMTGEFGLCGYFLEHDHDLTPDQRLQFRRHERPPPFDAAMQPQPPSDQWSAERLAKARRNYALDYLRNGLCTLAQVIGAERAAEHGRQSARLIGLQESAALANALQAKDGDVGDVMALLSGLFSGMGDPTQPVGVEAGSRARPRPAPATRPALAHTGLRVVQGLRGQERELVLGSWCALWQGVAAAMRAIHRLEWSVVAADSAGDATALQWWVAD